jgi:hypothetical protein
MAEIVDLSSRDPNQDKIVRALKQAVEGEPARVTTYAVSGGEAVPYGFGSKGGGLTSMDTEAFFNMRDWLRKACEAAGGRFTGGGIGMGQADIDIELEGCHYNISIRPLPRAK